MAAAAAMMIGSCSFLNRHNRITVAIARIIVGKSRIERLASTITAPVIAPMAAAGRHARYWEVAPCALAVFSLGEVISQNAIAPIPYTRCCADSLAGRLDHPARVGALRLPQLLRRQGSSPDGADADGGRRAFHREGSGLRRGR